MSLIYPGGKKQAWVKDGLQKIHTVFPDKTECAEEFETKENLCILRKWRRVDKLGRLSDWEYEIGEAPPIEFKKEISNDLFQAEATPVISRHDSEGFYLFKITNMTWPENNYNVTVEDNYIVVRTANKKFFKKLQITDLLWQKIPLVQQFVKFKHYNNTVVIFYQKPPGIVAFEKAAVQARQQNIKQDGCQAE